MDTIPKAEFQIGPSMALAMMMAPKDNGTSFVDAWGYTWNQETETGYRREHDGFYLPNMKMYDHYHHSVEARIEIWNQIQNSDGKTVVKTINFSDLFP